MKRKAASGELSEGGIYSKEMILAALRISQKTWSKMLSEGLQVQTIGRQRWVLGRDLIAHVTRTAERRPA